MNSLAALFCHFLLAVSSLAQQDAVQEENEPTGRAAEQLREAIKRPMVFADPSLRDQAILSVSPQVISSSSYDPSGFSRSEEDDFGVVVEHRPWESLSLRLTPELGYQRVHQLTNGEAGSNFGTCDNLNTTSRAELAWKPGSEWEATGWWQKGWLENYWQSYFAQNGSSGAALQYRPSHGTQCALNFSQEQGTTNSVDAFNRLPFAQQGGDCGLSLGQRLGTLPLSLWGNSSLQWNDVAAATGSYGSSGPEIGTGIRVEPTAQQSWNVGVSASQLAFTGGKGQESIQSIFTEWKQELSSAASLRFGANYQEAAYQPGIADLSYSDQGNRFYLSAGPQVRLTRNLDARLDMAYRLGQPDLRTDVLQIPDRWLLFSVQGHF
ncbi:MAG: hypothetical protein PHO89_03840 [Methylacidiphilaceae bacterium]|nr:hypothetical protein [Candidatus Methylacidiphilaceae bacterium]